MTTRTLRIARLFADGRVTWEERPGTRITLAELQSMVGGYIERVPMPDDFPGNLWANEEGLLTDAPQGNENATFLMRREWVRFVRSEGGDPARDLNWGMMCLFGDCVWVVGASDDDEDATEGNA